MAFAFDTLGYAKKLRDSGVPIQQAEAHAEAAREFVMAELVTRYDLETAITGVRRDLDARHHELETAITTTRRDLEGAIATTRRDLEGAIERLTLRLTIRMGVMLAAGLTLLAAVLKVH